jgi:hypothetical protein
MSDQAILVTGAAGFRDVPRNGCLEAGRRIVGNLKHLQLSNRARRFPILIIS